MGSRPTFSPWLLSCCQPRLPPPCPGGFFLSINLWSRHRLLSLLPVQSRKMHRHVGALGRRMLLPVTIVLHPHSTPWSVHPHQTHLQSCPMSIPTLLCCPIHTAFDWVLSWGQEPEICHRGKRAQLAALLCPCPSNDPTDTSPCLLLPTSSLLPSQHRARGSVFLDLPLTPGCELDPCMHLHPFYLRQPGPKGSPLSHATQQGEKWVSDPTQKASR